MTVAPPRFLFIPVNQACNLSCAYCMFWKRAERSDLSVARRGEIVSEFAKLSPGGTVVICGGEAMLAIEAYYAVTTQCRDLGLGCFSVLNGTQVKPSTVFRLTRYGPSEISVSLDSPYPAIHDKARGAQLSHRQAVGALRLLLAERSGDAPKVYAMAVVSEQNYRDLDAFYDYVLNGIGADKLKLNFLQPTFGGAYPDIYFAENVIKDAAALLKVLRSCDEKYGLKLSNEWLSQVAMYHRSIDRGNAIKGWEGTGTDEHICNSYDRNIMVGMDGVARLCFYPGSFPQLQLQVDGDMERFWSSADRSKMRSCNKYCGISHSVRRVSATRR